MSLAFMIKAYSSQDCRRIRILSINVMNEKTPKNRHRYCFVEIFLFKTHLFILPRTSRKTYWIGDPFTQVKSAKHMVKSKTKSISSLGAFSNFSKTERSIYNFLKIPAWNWRGSYLFCYGAWAQKESAKLQNMRACTGITGLSVWNLSDSSKSLDDRQIKGTWRCRQSRFLFFDSSRKDRSDSASRVVFYRLVY